MRKRVRQVNTAAFWIRKGSKMKEPVHDEYVVTVDYSKLRPGSTAMEPTPILTRACEPEDGRLQSAREALRQAQASVTAASIASCDCNTKTDNPVYHAAHCRWLKLITAMDNLDSIAEYLA